VKVQNRAIAENAMKRIIEWEVCYWKGRALGLTLDGIKQKKNEFASTRASKG